MSCEIAKRDAALYLYGELTPEAEEKLEQHFSVCVDCAREIELQKTLMRALDENRQALPVGLLNECRGTLAHQIRQQPPGPVPNRFWAHWRQTLDGLMHSNIGFRVPVGAMTLVTVGYLGAQITPRLAWFSRMYPNSPREAGLVNVRSVQPEENGRVRLVYDVTQQRQIVGRMDEPEVLQIALQAMREKDDPGVRVEMAETLKDHAGDAEIRNSLLGAVEHDVNSGVRLAALKGLKQFSGEPKVRDVLIRVLQNDQSEGVRVQVVDLLIAHQDEKLVGVLQQQVGRDSNPYVKTRCSSALRDLNASPGTF